MDCSFAQKNAPHVGNQHVEGKARLETSSLTLPFSASKDIFKMYFFGGGGMVEHLL